MSWYLSSSRQFSCTSVTFFPTKRKAVPSFPLKRQRKAQKIINKKVHPEFVAAQYQRKKWEYPVQPDQRSSWKHRRWYDVFHNKWVDTLPRPHKRYSVLYKKYRQHLFNPDTPYERFRMLLDSYRRKKYIVESFNQEVPISNLSYYYQYLTQTKYVHGLPYSVQNSILDDKFMANFHSFVKNVLILEHNSPLYKNEEDPLKRSRLVNTACMKAILRYLVTSLTSENTSLQTCDIDYDVENCLFWFRGRGFLKWTLPDNHPVAFQCHDPVLMQIRTEEDLPSYSALESNFSTSSRIPSFYTTPHIFKLPLRQYRNTINPGYRLYAGDCNQNYQYAYEEGKLEELPPPCYSKCRHGHTQLLLLPETYSRDWYKESMEHSDISGEIEEHLKGHGIMSGWVWTAAQAHYAQHWMDNDIEKPICSQSIVTDGQWLSFFCYQLNTIAVDADNIVYNHKRNICYGRTSVKMFDEVNEDGVVGLNNEALSLLVKFIRNCKEQHNLVATNSEEIEAYNESLHVQEPDHERPEIEVQKPLHKLERDRRIKELEEARKLHEAETAPLRKKLKNLLIG